MADLNQLLAARYSRALDATLGMQEQEGVKTVSPELQTVYVLENDPFELQLLKDVRPWVDRLIQAAVAAEISWVGIANPAGSGVLCVVEHMVCSRDALDQLQLFQGGIVATDVDTSESVEQRDFRRRSEALPVLIRSGAGAATVGNVLAAVRVPANTPFDFGILGPLLLVPGTEIRIYTDTLDDPLIVTYSGYLRPFRNDEQP